MKTLVFFNNKGGVGKTTLTCNVVSYLNLHKNKRVLLINADPQCNALQLMLADDVIENLYLNFARSTTCSRSFGEIMTSDNQFIRSGEAHPNCRPTSVS